MSQPVQLRSIRELLAREDVRRFTEGRNPCHEHGAFLQAVSAKLGSLLDAAGGTLSPWSVPVGAGEACEGRDRVWADRFARFINRQARTAGLAEPFQVRIPPAAGTPRLGKKGRAIKVSHTTLIKWEKLKRDTATCNDDELLKRAISGLRDNLVEASAGPQTPAAEC